MSMFLFCLQTANKGNDASMVSLMMTHAKAQLMTGTWRLLGWWKAASTTEGSVYNPRLHILNLTKNEPVVRFIAPAPPQNDNAPANDNAAAPANNAQGAALDNGNQNVNVPANDNVAPPADNAQGAAINNGDEL